MISRLVTYEEREYPESSVDAREFTAVDNNQIEALVLSLPGRLKVAVDKAQPQRDTGNTGNMELGTESVISELRKMFVELATSYPHNLFGRDAGEYFDRLIADRAPFWEKLNEPGGPGTGGSIVSIENIGYAEDDAKSIVEAIAMSALSGESSIDFDQWRKDWANQE